jgi:flagellar hook assembly protein FlgD
MMNESVDLIEEESDVEENPVIENVRVEEVVEDNNEKVITGPAKKKTSRSSNIQKDTENVLGSKAADRALAKIIVEEKEEPKMVAEKIALWSNKNIRWSDVGAVNKGYNIVTEEASEKWLSRDGIRKATPEEVATYFGN